VALEIGGSNPLTHPIRTAAIVSTDAGYPLFNRYSKLPLTDGVMANPSRPEELKIKHTLLH
jgi:hypothetical protein